MKQISAEQWLLYASRQANTLTLGAKSSLQINIPRAKSFAPATSKWDVKCLIKEAKHFPWLTFKQKQIFQANEHTYDLYLAKCKRNSNVVAKYLFHYICSKLPKRVIGLKLKNFERKSMWFN